ncbi:hypothetical protein ACFCYH_05770 [Streptomyces sp. NPDC056400]|uniref:hypothetical protein n=1 Tax=Streptomyces sp. NPDC056400 TaxID=3345808 RepID=UPI0035DE019E
MDGAKITAHLKDGSSLVTEGATVYKFKNGNTQVAVPISGQVVGASLNAVYDSPGKLIETLEMQLPHDGRTGHAQVWRNGTLTADEIINAGGPAQGPDRQAAPALDLGLQLEQAQQLPGQHGCLVLDPCADRRRVRRRLRGNSRRSTCPLHHRRRRARRGHRVVLHLQGHHLTGPAPQGDPRPFALNRSEGERPPAVGPG